MADTQRLRFRKKLVLAKVEETVGTAATLAASDAVLARDLEITPLTGETLERELIQPFLGHSSQGSVVANRHATVNFSVELSASGTAGTAPAWGGLLRACAMAETAVTSGTKSVTYTPVSASLNAITIGLNIDKQKQVLAGCRGTFTIEYSANQIPLVKFSFTGRYADPANVEAITPDVSDYQLAPPCGSGNAFVLMSNANLLLNTLTYDHAQEVTFESLIGNTDDNNLPQITDRKPTIQFTATAPNPNTLNLVKKAADADLTGAVSLAIGSGAGKVVTLAAPKVQLLEPSYEEINGTLAISGTLNCLPTAANNEMSLKLT